MTTDTRTNQGRVELYSRHVKYLYFRDCRETIRWHIIHRLSTLEKPLFPNLESVNIPLAQYQPHHASSPENMNTLFLAFSNSMKTLFINGIDSITEDEISSYLSVLYQKKAPLQKIVLGGHMSHNTIFFLNQSTLVSRAAPRKQTPRAAEVGLRPCDSSGGNTEREAAGWAGLTLCDFGLQLRSFPHISTIKISQ